MDLEVLVYAIATPAQKKSCPAAGRSVPVAGHGFQEKFQIVIFAAKY